jgi:group II intron reverse transcriptase/maturase
MTERSGSEGISPRLERIAELAREDPQRVLTTLAHYIDLDWLREAYRRTRKDAAPGVDGQTAEEYAADLEANLRSLLERFKSGLYRAPAVRRVRIPKGGWALRPLGIPTFEDKVLQRAVLMALEAVYEQDFLPCSYGFRPGRSAHQALEAFWRVAMAMGGGWVVEVDLQDFFETLDHAHLRSFLDRRVRDGVLRRAIGKWLKAGVLEAGQLRRPRGGTPQGGVISPLLANLYLHVVLDEWFEDEVKPRLRGEGHLFRYADDFILLFAREDDAQRVLDVLPKRLAKYGLRVHPDKTRRMRFLRPKGGGGRKPKGRSERSRPGSFTWLGFTHSWGKSRQGKWVITRRTSSKSFGRSLRGVADWLRQHRHEPIDAQHRVLCQKLRGHYAYFGVTGNADALDRYRQLVRRSWYKWLNRRSQRRSLTWPRYERLLQRNPLPLIRVVHSIFRRAANPAT